jgi:hypothetical protein
MASQVIVFQNIQSGGHIVVFWAVIPFFQNEWLVEWEGLLSFDSSQTRDGVYPCCCVQSVLKKTSG